MLWFGGITAAKADIQKLFKNILCYGSALGRHLSNFRRSLFKNILCYGSASDWPDSHGRFRTFKNILCYGSASPAECRGLLCYRI